MAVGRSIGLSDAQVDEIAKLPSGVAVVYQNNWISPVLTMIDKADVDERPYVSKGRSRIMTLKSARTSIVRMIMQPWFKSGRFKKDTLLAAQRVLELKRASRIKIKAIIEDYELMGGQLAWRQEDLPMLQALLQDVLDVTLADVQKIGSADELRELVASKLNRMKPQEINDICFVLTAARKE